MMGSWRTFFAAAAAIALPGASLAQTSAVATDIEMWRLACGTMEAPIDAFSDAHLYDGQTKSLTDSCYLIRNGDRHLLWDTGLPYPASAEMAAEGATVERGIVDQLRELGRSADDIDFVGISHHHFDHIGQAANFPRATLLMNNADVAAVRERNQPEELAALAPWLSGGGTITDIARDHDVFGDGSVTIFATPGHTPGHSSLLVRLPQTGAVLLSGDLYHFSEQVENRGVPSFNTDRADTLASFDRFQQMARALDATVIIQHEAGDITKLPAFPASAR